MRKIQLKTKIWLLLVAAGALFCAGCAEQAQQNEMAHAMALAGGNQELATQIYLQMEQNRVDAIMAASQGLQNAGAQISAGARNNPYAYPQVVQPVYVPQQQIQPMQIPQPARGCQYRHRIEQC